MSHRREGAPLLSVRADRSARIDPFEMVADPGIYPSFQDVMVFRSA